MALGGSGSEAFYECVPGAAARDLPDGYARRDVEASVLHRVVRENLETFLLECADAGGLPLFVQKDFTRYLDCGVLAKGFARFACGTCHDEILVAFSCKSRGVCPSCNARRAHDTAIHLEGNVLPIAPYRQWTLSFPISLRFLLARDARLFSKVLGLFVRSLFAFQRRRARGRGIEKPLPGAVAFLQRFGSALQLTPHVHLLALEGVFTEGGGGQEPVRFCPLPPPDDEEVEALLRKVALRTVALLRASGKLGDAEPSADALDFLRAHATKTSRLPLGDEAPAPRKGRRCAFLEGFSLHANTWAHENNREGLERLANYGARGPLSLERLSELPDGNLAYTMRRPSSSGAQVLVLPPVALLRKLAALVPPPRTNLVRFFGVLAPNARVRKHVVPKPPPPEQPEQPQAPTPTARAHRVPWAELLKRTFSTDVLACRKCGGRRRVVAVVVASATVREILEHLKLPATALPRARAQAPPQLELYA